MFKISVLVLATLFAGCISTEAPTEEVAENSPPAFAVETYGIPAGGADEEDLPGDLDFDPALNPIGAEPEIGTVAPETQIADEPEYDAESEVESITLASHVGTTVNLCPYLLVDNREIRTGRASIRLTDGTIREIVTGNGRDRCLEVPLGGPYEVRLVSGCLGRLVGPRVPNDGFYRETYLNPTYHHRALRFRCYETIGAP